MDQTITSFAPIAAENSKVLILGTMPGAMSLEKQEYYAYPQNQFWKIMFTLFAELPVPTHFEAKKALILQNKIALWDVLANCERKGSLDIHIKNQTENDIPGFLKKHTTIKAILFNGKESHKYYIRKFGTPEGIDYYVMPSTSPANTTAFEIKLQAWADVLQ